MNRAAGRVEGGIGYRFNDASLLTTALTHRSADHRAHNERLEFLGDGLLNFLIAERLYRERHADDEGDLSRLRSTLVRGETLADIAIELSLGDSLILGAGEMRSGGHRRRSILADALEALLGAVYLDGGLEAADGVVERLFGERLRALPDARLLKDAKTQLQEWLQARGLPLPVYEVVEVSGAEHAQQFRVDCRLPSPPGSFEGEGAGRRQAEQQAAMHALEALARAPDER